ncbi:MAG: TonB-dependent receptor, partial [Gammaproteobacteria bacterium]|nr:TonB-dependent receptor [Gammaproteobacteria bacterium]
ERLDYTIGYFDVEQDVATHEANVNLYYAQLNFIHGPDQTPSDSQALFAHATIRLTDALNLSLGLRSTNDDKSYTSFRRNPDGTLPHPCASPPPGLLSNPPNCALAGLFAVSDSFSSSRTDHRVALDYHLTDDIMLYGQVATGYKVGGINPRPFFLVQIETFAEEELDSVEFGFKTMLANGRVRLNGAVFANDYTNIQLQQDECELPFPPFFGGPCLQPGNVGDADSNGWEIELEAHPTDRLSFDFSLSSLDFDYTRTDPSTAVVAGMVTPWTPETTWSAGIQYDWTFNDGGTLGIRFDANFQDDVYGDAINAATNLIEGYTLANARLMWHSSDDDWEAALEITNLTDEIYYVNIFDQFLGTSGMTGAGIAPPRMWALHLTRNFDF